MLCVEKEDLDRRESSLGTSELRALYQIWLSVSSSKYSLCVLFKSGDSMEFLTTHRIQSPSGVLCRVLRRHVGRSCESPVSLSFLRELGCGGMNHFVVGARQNTRCCTLEYGRSGEGVETVSVPS